MNFSKLIRPLSISCCFFQGFGVLSAAEISPAPVVIEDIGLTLLWVAPGKLPGVTGDDPARTVKEGFWLGKTEVTQQQWKKIMSGRNPSRGSEPDQPVQQVTYFDIFPFVDRLNLREKNAGRLPEGYSYTLPNELQWVYAARAGDKTDGVATLDAQAWIQANSKSEIHAVATKAPNAWGFYDMRGNVWEWCQETPGISTTGRFVRGGSCMQGPAGCGYNSRLEVSLDEFNPFCGLRLALSKNPLVTPKAPAPEVAAKPQAPAPTLPLPRLPSVPPPSSTEKKSSQSIGGVRIESASLVVVFEDRNRPVNNTTVTPPSSPSPSEGGNSGGAVMGSISYRQAFPGITQPLPAERQELKDKVQKDLEKTMPGRHVLTRAGQGGKATHEDSFREIIRHSGNPGTDAILWVTDLNSPFTMEEVEQLIKVLAEKKISLHILSTLHSATDTTEYRRDSKPGFKLMEYVRNSGGSFRKDKLKE